MEKICEYCRKVFDPKKSHTLYCSKSHRQMAYIKRKMGLNIDEGTLKTVTKKQEPSIDGLKEGAETSIDRITKTIKPSIDGSENNPETSIDGEKKVNTSIDVSQSVNKNGFKTSTETLSVYKETSINQSKNVNPSIDISEKSVNSALNKDLIDGSGRGNGYVSTKKEEYTYVQSKFTEEVIDLGEENNTIFILSNFFSHRQPLEQIKWVSLRFRCLVECLLTFSEMKCVELNDLKEVCNAFTMVIQSNYFKNLPKSYPYINEIIVLRDNLKKICIENNKFPEIKFRLPKSKKRLMATRWQLAHYVPKKNFNTVKF